MTVLLPYTCDLAKAMIFIDGENLAIRYGNLRKSHGGKSRSDLEYVPGVLLWAARLVPPSSGSTPAVMRKYYYTSVQGDYPEVEKIAAQLKDLGIETPRVFKKNKLKGSKRVDVTLACDMLLHAAHKHYDVAVLVAGDDDYVPLVEAVQREGARVYVWFVSDGLSPALQRVADHFVNLDEYLL